jgi:hypothetical protein
VVRNPEEKIPLGRCMIIITLILNKYHTSLRAEFFVLRIGNIGAVSSTNVIKLWVPFKTDEFLNSLANIRF